MKKSIVLTIVFLFYVQNIIAAAAWTLPADLNDNISPDGTNGFDPAVVMNNNGNSVVMWRQYDGSKMMIFKSEYRGGSWTHPANLSDNISPDGEHAYNPKVAMDNNGNAIIVWYQSDGSNRQIFKSEYLSGSWTHPANLSDNISPDGKQAYKPNVAMADNGDAVITWFQFDSSSYRQIFKSRYHDNSWTHPANLSDNISPDGKHAYNPKVAIDDYGNTIIVWYQNDGTSNQIYIATLTVTVPPLNNQPDAVDDTYTVLEDQSMGYLVLANDSDIDGDTLTVTGVTTPGHGTATINGNGTINYITYEPDANYYGSDSFTYTVDDGSGEANATDTATMTVTVIPVNDQPNAVDDTAWVAKNSSVTINVLANDSDIDGDTLTVDLVTIPPSGTATNNGDGTITYESDANYSGYISFYYTVNDGSGAKNARDTAIVTVAVNKYISIQEPGDVEITHGSDPGYIIYNDEPETIVFTIQNIGPGALQLTADPPVSISDEGMPHNCISIAQQPATSINSGDSTSFFVQYSPDSVLFTERKTWISIESNDPDQPLYEFSIIINNIDTYNDYFSSNPAVADHTVSDYNKQTLKYLLFHLSQLENNGAITIDEPIALQNADASATTIGLTDSEHWSILGAKAAHAIWLDKNNIVSWDLADYDPAHLNDLFYTTNGHFFSVVDYSPSDVYGYMVTNSLIGSTILETIHNVFEDLRTTDNKVSFLHGSPSYGDSRTIYSLYDALTTYSDRGGGNICKIARHGCHSMTRIMTGMLRSVNIPGTTTAIGEWFETDHSSAEWQCVQLVLPHGDDIYTSTLKMTPTDEMLVPISIYTDPAYTDVCGTNPGNIARRHRALQALTYPDNYTTLRCCYPGNFGYVDCLDYITQTYGEVLTTTEIEDAVYEITNNYCFYP